MRIFKTQQEVDAVLVNGDFKMECDVRFEFNLRIAGNINARNIVARNIVARNIVAENIDAWNIDAGDIYFYASCCAYEKFVCKSIKGRRENARYFCLDGEVEIKPDEVVEEMTMEAVCAALGKQVKIIK